MTMNLETLNKANSLKRKIDELKSIASCFYYPQYNEEGNETGEVCLGMSRNPKIIIEYDDYEDGREEFKLPIILSEKFIQFIFNESASELQKCIEEFESL